MLSLHRSGRADELVAALGDLLAAPLRDPIHAEVVAVPTRGVERWLTQRLSHRLGTGGQEDSGVCANLRFPFPGTLVGEATATACDLDPSDDPWRPERAVWPLVEVIDAHGEDPDLDPLLAHLRAATPDTRRGEPGPLRRFAVARHLADLFDRYAVHRPDLVTAWVAGDLSPPADDPTAAWQAHLWRLLRERIGSPSPAERLADATRRLVAGPELLDWPERVSLFGLTRLPASHLQVLQAVATRRDVHLFLLHPSGRLWEAVASVELPADPSRAADPTARLAANPVLRSWGRDAREMQLVLAAHGVTGGEHRAVPGDDAPETLLHRLQADIRADRGPPGAPTAGADTRPRLDPHDRSLQIHSCHGRTRQVEVLRDAVLHLLAADERLEPRDVIVMCPDIEAFAPLVHAAFGTDDPRGPDEHAVGVSGIPRLRVRLADRSLRQTNPLLAVAARLLDLAGSRVTASDVLDLASLPPVSRRFRLDPEDLSLLERWVADTGIRWGLDAAHRQPWGLDAVEANTWAAGLDRLLLGTAMTDNDARLFGGVVPYGDLPSSAVDLAGRVAELLNRLGSALEGLAGPQSIGCWVDAALTGTALLADVAPDDGWQRDQLRRVLAEAHDESRPVHAVGMGQRPGGPVLCLDEIRALLDTRLQGRPTRANFRTGDLTVCTLVPMRSVPHRVVALLGLDDGAFPRHPETDGDDLLLHDPRVGDRDARSEDRQLLLDAVLAATDHLIVTYSGRDERTNRRRPPAVPVAELLDVVDATFRGPAGGPARRHVVVEHPLQAFDARNFVPGELAGAEPWSYDHVELAGARAAIGHRRATEWLDGALPPVDEPVLQLDHLVGFVEHPVRTFLRRRLGLFLAEPDAGLADDLPVELDALQQWGIGDRLLAARLAGIPPGGAGAAERSRGLLPPGDLADRILVTVGAEVEGLVGAVDALGFGAGATDSLDVRVDLPDGRSLIGTVPNSREGTLLFATYSRLAPKHRLAAWVRFLAVSAAWPELAAAAVTLGRGAGRGRPPQVARLGPLGGTAQERRARALELLCIVVDLYQRGLCAPLPLACATSAAWAAGRRLGDEERAFSDAGKAWHDGLFPGEASDVDHVYVWGRLPLRALLAKPPALDEVGPGWSEGETSRFGVLARRLWDPLLDHERVETPQ